MRKAKKSYGMELIVDLHDCDLGANVSKKRAEDFIIKVCDMTKMHRHGRPLWWVQKSKIPFWHGTSVLQFIKTSSIVMHLLPKMHAVYINVFTCKPFDPKEVVKFAKTYWKAGRIASNTVVIRK